jgi:hypothetical protein
VEDDPFLFERSEDASQPGAPCQGSVAAELGDRVVDVGAGDLSQGFDALAPPGQYGSA